MQMIPRLIQKTYQPQPDDIFINPLVPEEARFIEQIATSFVNKAVSLTFANDRPCFDFAVFEAIRNKDMKIIASSSHFRLKQLAGRETPAAFKDFLKKTRPIRLNHENNISAQLIRKAIIALTHEDEIPDVEILNIKTDKRLHPKLKTLLGSSMNYGVGIPLFYEQQPIGFLWGIRRKPLTKEQREDIVNQMKSLYRGIDVVLNEELNGDRDAYFARRKVEKIDTTARMLNLFYTRYPRQHLPIKSLMAYSTRYNRSYRQDTNFIIPTENGFSISMKRFLPEKPNKEKRILLMIPGFFCNRSLHDRFAKEMALSYGYIVFTLDVRGRSKFTMPERGNLLRYNWTVDDYIWKDFPVAIKWISEQHPGYKIVPIGHSMGGMIPEFYTAAYEQASKKLGLQHLPDPHDYLEGIVAITSPSYVNLMLNLPGFDIVNNSVRAMSDNAAIDSLLNIVSTTLSSAFGTVDLNKFFTFLHNVTNSARMFSFNISNRIPTIKDFIGYPQITPAEWYFLMEDVFCEESMKVIFQFTRAQLSRRGFLSYDQKLNYTEQLPNLRLPLMTVTGTLDTIAPPETATHAYDLAQSEKKHMVSYEQGHLGIVTHPATIKALSKDVSDWLKAL